MSEQLTVKNPLCGGAIAGQNIDPESYHRQTVARGSMEFVMSRGHLMEVQRCPHRWFMGYESEETKATEWGSLVDCLALTPERLALSWAVAPKTYFAKGMKCPSCGTITDAKSCRKCKVDRVETAVEKDWDWAASFCREWREGMGDCRVVRASTHEDAMAAVFQLMADPQIAELIACSQKQVLATAIYADPATGIMVPVKALIDMVPGAPYQNALADLKTCSTAGQGPWRRTVFERSYHVQAAFYLDIYAAATGDERVEFLHVIQESYAPWEVGKRVLSSEFLEEGRRAYLGALARYCQCLANNLWPGYDEGRMVLNGWSLTEPEAWMVNRQ